MVSFFPSDPNLGKKALHLLPVRHINQQSAPVGFIDNQDSTCVVFSISNGDVRTVTVIVGIPGTNFDALAAVA